MGDILVSVNQKPVKQWSIAFIREQIQGKPGSFVIIDMMRPETEEQPEVLFRLNIMRGSPEFVDNTSQYAPEIAWLPLSNFSLFLFLHSFASLHRSDLLRPVHLHAFHVVLTWCTLPLAASKTPSLSTKPADCQIWASGSAQAQPAVGQAQVS